jgi:AcrR family transcriptional regulator
MGTSDMRALDQVRRTKAAPLRRMGPVGSENWHAMLDAAEEILREEGYAALTSRRIAERIGVKQRLVYYYFKTMDELIVETFRRLVAREFERLRKALTAERPVRELWYICIRTADARLISEFMALTHRIQALRSEVVAFIEDSRRMQLNALSAALKRDQKQSSLPAEALAIMATGVSLLLTREAALGVTTGHAVVTDVIWRYLRELEP